jgi:tetratricopeptide (TPR) repeat protein
VSTFQWDLFWSGFFEWLLQSPWSDRLTVVSLLIAGYTAARVSNVARWIREDRSMAQGFQNPVDIYFSIQKAEALLERLQHQWMFRGQDMDELNRALRGLRSSAAFLGSYFYFVGGPQFSEANAFLAAGRFFWERRDHEKARDFFQKALENDHDTLTSLEREECVSGLLACNHLLWDFPAVARVRRMAEDKKIAISQHLDSSFFIFLHCLRESFVDTTRHLVAGFSKRGKHGVSGTRKFQ